jgi:hypothetical protein
MKRNLLVVAAALAVALQGCSTFYAEAEQPSVCLTLTPAPFSIQGGGGIAPPGGFSAAYSGSVDLGLSDVVPDFMLNGPSQDRILRFLSFRATATLLGGNFDFVDSVQLHAQGAPGSQPVELGQYVRGSQVNVTSISFPSGAPNVNLSDFLASGGLTLHVDGNVSVPGGQRVPATWSAEVETCLYAKVHKTFQQMIDGT